MAIITLRRRRGESGPHLDELYLVMPMLLLLALHRVPLLRRRASAFRRLVSQ